MTISDEILVQLFVDQSLHDLTHAIVESCYRKARRCTHDRQFDLADNWNLLARRMTQIEDFAARMSLYRAGSPL